MNTLPDPWDLIFTDIFLSYEMFVNAIDDFGTLIHALWRFSLHLDLYNSSLIVGKIAKILAQFSFYMMFEKLITFVPPNVVVTKNL